MTAVVFHACHSLSYCYIRVLWNNSIVRTYCTVPPSISSSQWVWCCRSTTDNTWGRGRRWHNSRAWRWVQWWLTQHVTTARWTLSVGSSIILIKIHEIWLASHDIKAETIVTVFYLLATNISDGDLCWDELWAKYDQEKSCLSLIPHSQQSAENINKYMFI